jgi:L-malate glycosyltransferase
LLLKSKKIVFLTHYGGLYGANISLLNYLVHSKIAKNNITVFVPEFGPFVEQLSKLGIENIVQRFSPNIYQENQHFFKRNWNVIKKLRWLYHLYFSIKKINPSLIYSNSSILYYGFFLGKLLRIPHVWHLREFGVPDFKLYPDGGFNFQKYLLKKNTYNVAISKSISEHYQLQNTNSQVVYNGVTTKEDFAKTFRERNFAGALRFGVVGAIMPYKKQLEIVRAFHAFLQNNSTKAPHTLHLIGAGFDNYMNDIVAYVEINKLQDHVIFAGHVDERHKIYDNLDMLLNGAENEGFGRVTAEAMAYGVVPIGFNHGGTAEIIKHQITGVLFNSFEELPDILRHYDANRAALKQLQKSIGDNFNAEFFTETYCAQLDAILSTQLQQANV